MQSKNWQDAAYLKLNQEVVTDKSSLDLSKDNWFWAEQHYKIAWKQALPTNESVYVAFKFICVREWVRVEGGFFVKRRRTAPKERRRKDSGFVIIHTENSVLYSRVEGPCSKLGNAAMPVCVLSVHLSLSVTLQEIWAAQISSTMSSLNGCAPSRVHFII